MPARSLPARSLLASAALGAALVLASAGLAVAADLKEPVVTTEDGMQVMRLKGHETSGKFIPKGGKPVDHPTGGPKAGDGFSFVEELRQGDALVGTDSGVCTILAEPARTAKCEVTVTFAKGTVTVVGVGTDGQKDSTYKLVGGTGAYKGVSGIVKAKELSETDSDLTLIYSTAASRSEAPAKAAPAKAAPAKGAPAEPKVTTDGAKQTIHVVAEHTGGRFLPKGGEPTDAFPSEKNPPKPGDAFSFTENLEQDGTLVGTDKGGCTFGDPISGPLKCAVTLSFPKGFIDLEGEFVHGRPNTMRLVQGTGAYKGIAGTVRVADIDEDHTDLTLTFTTSGAAPQTDATQVAVVPVGGAATGGGTAAQGVPSGLVGFGAIAAATGAGLFGFGRLIGRRTR